MARDPMRIPKVIEKLRAVWHAYPDMRLGQLVDVTVHYGTAAYGDRPGPDVFNAEEDVIMAGLEYLLDELRSGKVGCL